jgi:CheY-like chemotaxis protein
MLKSSNPGKWQRDGADRLSLELFNGLVHQGRPFDTSSRGPSELIAVALLLVLPAAFFVMGLGRQPGNQVGRWVDRVAVVFRRPAAPTPQQGVLVVTANAVNQFDVTATVGPRGYAAYCERTAKQGMDRLRAAPGQFKIVVVDGDLPGSNAMVRTIRQSWPDKYVIVLTGPRKPASLAQSLLNLL